MTEIHYGSICSGVEAAWLAWHGLGWTCDFVAEVEPAPCAVLAARLGAGMPEAPLDPDAPYIDDDDRVRRSAALAALRKIPWPANPLVPNFGDMTTIRDRIRRDGYPAPDVFIGGTPCFPAGTLILTRDGLKPIQDVREGDEVLTHRQRWRKVVHTMRRLGETVVLKGQGHHGLVTTSEHPFWAKDMKAAWDNTRRRYVRHFSEPDWRDASDMAGKFWSTPAAVPGCDVPSFDVRPDEQVLPALTPDFFWFVGAWLGDGWLRTGVKHKERGSTFGAVMLCGHKKDAAVIRSHLAQVGLSASESEERTTVRFTIYSKPLCRWLETHFGRGAEGKTIPTWALGMDERFRSALFAGYLFADGHCMQQVKSPTPAYRFSTVSRRLAVGVRLLAASIGMASTECLMQMNRDHACIEGRTVNERPGYQVTVYSQSRSAFAKDDMMWGRVRSVRPTGNTETVFNFEVEEDNSYVADGIVVHNCQSFSIAGRREGLDDARGNLALEYTLIVDEIDAIRAAAGLHPCVAVWENVPGVFSSKDNAFGCFLAALVGAVDAITPAGRGGKWTRSGLVRGPKRTAAWRTLDAQFFGVPQRRERVFVVASAGSVDPARILFECEGVRRDTPPRRESREAASAAVAGSAGSGSPNGVVGALPGVGPGNGWRIGADEAAAGQVIVTPQHTVPTLDANYGKLQGCSGQDLNHGHAHLMPVAFNNTGQGWWNEADAAAPVRKGDANGSGGARESTLVAPQAFGGNRQSGPLDVATARNAHSGPHGRLDFESETFVVEPFAFKASHFTRDKDGAPSTVYPPLSADADKGDQDPLVLAPATAYRTAGDGAVFDLGDRTAALTTQTDPSSHLIAFSCKDHGGDAGAVAPTLRAMQHSGSHQNAGGQVAVAFVQNQRDEVRIMDVPGAIPSQPGVKQQTYLAFQPLQGGRSMPVAPVAPTLEAGTGNKAPAVLSRMAVRRLTPTECEKLQGQPTVRRTIRIEVCSDHRNNGALAAMPCRKLQSSAFPAAGNALMSTASSVTPSFSSDQQTATSPADVLVQINCAQSVVRLPNLGKSLSFASDAGANGTLRLPVPSDLFARLSVLGPPIAAQQIIFGRAASPLNTMPSTLPLNGSAPVRVSGHVIAALASDAARYTDDLRDFLTSITLPVAQRIQIAEQTTTTWCCFVAAAMSSFIPEQIRSKTSYTLEVDVDTGWTHVPYTNGKPMADGPRYRMIGNSFAVPVVRWIG